MITPYCRPFRGLATGYCLWSSLSIGWLLQSNGKWLFIVQWKGPLHDIKLQWEGFAVKCGIEYYNLLSLQAHIRAQTICKFQKMGVQVSHRTLFSIRRKFSWAWIQYLYTCLIFPEFRSMALSFLRRLEPGLGSLICIQMQLLVLWPELDSGLGILRIWCKICSAGSV